MVCLQICELIYSTPNISQGYEDYDMDMDKCKGIHFGDLIEFTVYEFSFFSLIFLLFLQS